MQVYDGDNLVELDDKGRCPKCNANWDNGDILETFKALRAKGDDYYATKTDAELVEITRSYGSTPENPKKFSRLIGFELPYDHPEHYDGVSFWRCPDCSYDWQRFAPKAKTRAQDQLQQRNAESDTRRQELLEFLRISADLLVAAGEHVDESEKQKVKLSLEDAQTLIDTAIFALQFTPGNIPEDLVKSLRTAVKHMTKAWGFCAN
jgi:hypothetical protein